jgi:hypothetical protein
MESLFSTKYELKVIDDLVPMELVERLWKYAHDEASWAYKGFGAAADPLTTWVVDIMNYFDTLNADERAQRWQSLATSMPYLHRIWALVSNAVPGTYALSRVFLNGHTFGLGDGIHDDGGEDAYTFLVYITPDWEPAWSGETMFYTEATDDIVAAVLPKPGRLVFFDARIPHAGRAPARLCTDLRITLAFQTIRTSPA